MTNVAPWPTRLLPAVGASPDRAAVVTEPDSDEVVVRWRLGRPQPWRCGACGPLTTADCMHTFSAGVSLAEELLGLTRVIELDTRKEPN